MSDDEDDYMSASILEAATQAEKKLAKSRSETYSEKRRREMEMSRRKGEVKSLGQMEKERREEGLRTDVLKEENKGFKLLEKLGFKKGMALGKEVVASGSGVGGSGSGNGEGDESKKDTTETTSELPTMRPRLMEPIPIFMKTDKRGLTLTTRKRPLSPSSPTSSTSSTSDTENPSTKRKKPTEQDFRGTITRKLDERRATGELVRARRTVQNLDEDRGVSRHLLWMPERESVVGLEDGVVVGEVVEEGEGEEKVVDPEVEEFEGMELEDKLRKVVGYLRSNYFYCLWCGDRYQNEEEMNTHCPGEWRDDHDD
ncbi:G patch domain-containing protein 11 [Phlyctochytrium planicorne]|nr:G patch domain-containing protein 11 [Phlyctochytrium planicorne]